MPAPTQVAVVRLESSGRVEHTTYSVFDIPEPVSLALLTNYKVTPLSSPIATNDMTSFVVSQAYLARDNLPYAMSLLDPPKRPRSTPAERKNPITDKPVLDRWGKTIREFPGILPDVISSEVEGWRIEYWRTLDPAIELRDIIARFHDDVFYSTPTSKAKYPHVFDQKLFKRITNNLSMMIQRWKKEDGAPRLEQGKEELAKQSLPRLDKIPVYSSTRGTVWPIYLDGSREYAKEPCRDAGSDAYQGYMFEVTRLGTQGELAHITTARGLTSWKKQEWIRLHNLSQVPTAKIKSWNDISKPNEKFRAKAVSKKRSRNDSTDDAEVAQNLQTGFGKTYAEARSEQDEYDYEDEEGTLTGLQAGQLRPRHARKRQKSDSAQPTPEPSLHRVGALDTQYLQSPGLRALSVEDFEMPSPAQSSELFDGFLDGGEGYNDNSLDL